MPSRALLILLFLFALALAVPQAAGPQAANAQAPARFTTLAELGIPPSRFVVSGGYVYALEGQTLVLLSLPPTGRARVLARIELGHQLLQDLALDGERLYVLAASGLSVLDVSDALAPRELGFLPGGGQALAVQGGWAYVAARQAGVRVIDARDPRNMAFSDTLPAGGAATLLQISMTSTTGNPLLLAGSDGRVLLFEAADPAHPRALATLPVSGTTSIALAPAGDSAWIAAGGGAYAYDLRVPSEPKLAGRYAPPAEAQRVLVQGDYAYVADLRDGLKVFSILQPVQPLLVWTELDQPAHDVIMAGGQLVLSTPSGLRLYDLTDPARPHLSATLGLGSPAWGMALGRKRLYVATERALVAVELSTGSRAPAGPREVARLDLPREARGVALAADETRAYAALYQPGGLAVLDVRDAQRWKLEGTLATGGEGCDLAARAGTVWLAAGSAGLQVIDVINPRAPALLGSVPAQDGQSFSDVALGEVRAYVAAGDRVLLVDIGSRKRPTAVSELAAPARGLFLQMATGFLAAAGSGELHWANVRVLPSPVDVGVYRRPAPPLELALSGDQLLVASGGPAPAPDLVLLAAGATAAPRETARFGDGVAGVRFLRFAGNQVVFSAGYRGLLRYELGAAAVRPPSTDPAHPLPFQAWPADPVYTPPTSVEHLVIDGTELTTAGDRGWSVLDTADPSVPQIVAGATTELPVVQAARDGGMLYAADARGLVSAFDLQRAQLAGTWNSHAPLSALAAGDGLALAGDALGVLHLLDLRDPAHVAELARIPLPGAAQHAALQDGRAFVAAGPAGVRIVDVSAPTAGLWPQAAAVLSATIAIAAGPQVLTLDGRMLRIWDWSSDDTQVPRHLAAQIASSARQLVLDGDEKSARRVYTLEGSAVKAFDLTPPYAAASLPWPRGARAVQSVGGPRAPFLLIGDDAGLSAVDWSVPGRPRSVAVQPALGAVSAIAPAPGGSLVWAAGARLAVLDTSRPMSPTVLAAAELPQPAGVLAVAGTRVLAGSGRSIAVYEWDGAGQILMRATIATPGDVLALAAREARGYAAVDGDGIWVLDLSPDAAPRVIVTYPAPAGANARGFALAGASLWVAWGNAWQALDASHPQAAPAEIAALALGQDASAQALDIDAYAGRAAVAAGRDGVWLLDVRDPSAPSVSAHITTTDEVRGVALRDMLYVADGRCGLRVYDVRDARAPRDLGRMPARLALDVAARGDTLYLADSGGLRIVRFDAAGALPPPPDPAQPQPVDGAQVQGAAFTLRWLVADAPCESLTYDVYLGAGTSAPVRVAQGLPAAQWTAPASQAYAAGEYRWQVAVRDGHGGETRGPEWRFTLGAPQAAPTAEAGATAQGQAPPDANNPDDSSRTGIAVLVILGLAVVAGMVWSRASRSRAA